MNLRNTKAIVIGYPHQWHWVLSAEYSLIHSKDKVVLFDFSNLGLLAFRQPIFPLSANYRFMKSVKKILKMHDIQILSIKFDFMDQIRALVASVRQKYPSIIDENELEFTSIYPSLVNKFDDTRINVLKHKFSVRMEFAIAHLTKIRLNHLKKYQPRSLVTVNGRFTNNFEVKIFAKNNSLPVTFLEFGSSKDRIEEYLISPHSFSELADKMHILWKGDEEQKAIAHEFFRELSSFDRSSGIAWTRNMIPNALPPLRPGRRLCVYFTSSQKEFVGVGDIPDPSHFETQFAAFEALYKELSAHDEWDFFIRRHPFRDEQTTDPDGYYWNKYKNYKNIIIIEPDSDVDSYALGFKADLVAHYNSSIGAQLIYGGHRSVLTMGNAMWSSLVPETLGRNSYELNEFLKDPIKKWNPESILAWAYFRSSFGCKFKFFEFVPNLTQWKIKGL